VTKKSFAKFLEGLNEINADFIQKRNETIIFGVSDDLTSTIEEFKKLSDTFEIAVEYSNTEEQFFDQHDNLIEGRPINFISFNFTGFCVKVYSFHDNFQEAYKIYTDSK